MPIPSAQAVINGIAIVALAGLGGMLICHSAPAGNEVLLATIVGALAATITGPAAGKLADKITSSTGAGAVIQPDAPASSVPPQA